MQETFANDFRKMVSVQYQYMRQKKFSITESIAKLIKALDEGRNDYNKTVFTISEIIHNEFNDDYQLAKMLLSYALYNNWLTYEHSDISFRITEKGRLRFLPDGSSDRDDSNNNPDTHSTAFGFVGNTR